MTKLEEKLIELGYKRRIDIPYGYYKYAFRDGKGNFILIHIEILDNRIIYYSVQNITTLFRKQSEINNLQQAFNEMQKDLEVLRNVE